jgi:DNA-binding LytR/AlgR family response regulator
MFIELEIIKNHTFRTEDDYIIENRLININEIQQIVDEDSKTYIILKNGMILNSKETLKELKQRFNYIINKMYK